MLPAVRRGRRRAGRSRSSTRCRCRPRTCAGASRAPSAPPSDLVAAPRGSRRSRAGRLAHRAARALPRARARPRARASPCGRRSSSISRWTSCGSARARDGLEDAGRRRRRGRGARASPSAAISAARRASDGRLHVVEVDRDVRRELRHLGAQRRGREVAGDVRDALQVVRERALDEERLEVRRRAARRPRSPPSGPCRRRRRRRAPPSART